MSSGVNRLAVVELDESAADVAPLGRTRIARKGGLLLASADGGPYTALGSGAGQITTYVTTGANVTTLSLNDATYPINGETDGGYKITGEIVANGASNLYALRPNGTAPASQRVLIEYVAGGVGGGTFQDTQFFISSRVNQVYLGFNIEIASSKTGHRRPYKADVWVIIAGAVETKYEVWGDWDDTTTAIADLQLFCSVASGIGAGSWAALTRLGRGI